ncbi:MAG TPA: ABC transporter ATP-binding protein [Acidimicrobiales bacterium]|jgi:oligopeptide transport system ATP-binding protein|nr:ABC transporter ATP-binding protein [Acidimicrobiales bacterium]
MAPEAIASDNVLEAHNVHVVVRDRSQRSFLRPREVEILAGVSLNLGRGETLGLLGESGCGKTTLARSLCGLMPIQSGSITFTSSLGRGSQRPPVLAVQMVFQDPFGSLNPRRRIREIIAEGWEINPRLVPRHSWEDRLHSLMRDVGLPAEHLHRFPAALSGGERQRVAIARALAVDPEVVICDEAVSALDASVKAQIIELLAEVQARTGVAYIFISHDTSSVRRLSDRVAVMYLGKIVESGPSSSVFSSPAHPYTMALLAAIPRLRPWRSRAEQRRLVAGEVPSFANPPSGCRYRTRCWMAKEICAQFEPPEVEVGDGHVAACHFATAQQPVPANGDTVAL